MTWWRLGYFMSSSAIERAKDVYTLERAVQVHLQAPWEGGPLRLPVVKHEFISESWDRHGVVVVRRQSSKGGAATSIAYPRNGLPPEYHSNTPSFRFLPSTAIIPSVLAISTLIAQFQLTLSQSFFASWMVFVPMADCGMLPYLPLDGISTQIPSGIPQAVPFRSPQLCYILPGIYDKHHDRPREGAVSPTLGEFDKQAEIRLDLTNVVKILGLYEKIHLTLKKHPEDEILKSRLRIVTGWVKSILEKYDEVCSESRVVVDLFVKNWSSTLKDEGELESSKDEANHDT
ncbi:hypothetical protein FA13DRAFT_1711829 [Coprinellus micaceus]|uniref:Uncharacterized protein n=1 Tax=Coprinellus micaceus TaxID=71717 RepID=A0A4Y7T342_COPMI|nr:hypothetical protein FA13DRAFT_1711829 [Coprinellus micaceus]